MKHLLIILMFCLSAPLSMTAQTELSNARKGVKTSGDVLLVAMPLTTLTGVIIEKDWTGLKQAAFTTATTLGATYLLKYTVKKQRPDGSDNHSFPSAHTSILFANAGFVQRRYGWKFGAPAYVLATYVGWSRTFGKKHGLVGRCGRGGHRSGKARIFSHALSPRNTICRLPPVSDGEHFGLSASFTL